MTIVLLDQFLGPTPYALSQADMPWEDFLEHVKAGNYDAKNWRKAVITDETVKLPMATTAYCEKDGRVAIWRTCWDTSG